MCLIEPMHHFLPFRLRDTHEEELKAVKEAASAAENKMKADHQKVIMSAMIPHLY